MEKIDVQRDVRYVVATMVDGSPKFQFRDFAKKEWKWYDNISAASKAVNRGIAGILLGDYINHYTDNNIVVDPSDYAILPIEVSYKILDNDGIVVDAGVAE